jgi:hypothetical protein
MLSTSKTISRQLPRSNQASARYRQYHKEQADGDTQILKRYQLGYRKRKAAGFCTCGGCRAKPAVGYARCVYCGLRRGFWGVRCLICLTSFSPKTRYQREHGQRCDFIARRRDATRPNRFSLKSGYSPANYWPAERLTALDLEKFE